MKKPKNTKINYVDVIKHRNETGRLVVPVVYIREPYGVVVGENVFRNKDLFIPSYYAVRFMPRLFSCEIKLSEDVGLGGGCTFLSVRSLTEEGIEFLAQRKKEALENFPSQAEEIVKNNIDFPTAEKPVMFFWKDGDDCLHKFVEESLEAGLKIIDDVLDRKMSLEDFFEISL